MTPPVEDISLETGAAILLLICCCCCCSMGCRFDPPWVGKTTVSPTAKIAVDDSIVIRDIDWDGEGIEEDDSFDAATLIQFFLFVFFIQFRIEPIVLSINIFICYAADVVRNCSKMDALCYRFTLCENIWCLENANNFSFSFFISSLCPRTSQKPFTFTIIYWCKQNEPPTMSNRIMNGIFFRCFFSHFDENNSMNLSH